MGREGKRWTLCGSHQYTLMINSDYVFETSFVGNYTLKNFAEIPSHGQKMAKSNDMIEILGCFLGTLENDA